MRGNSCSLSCTLPRIFCSTLDAIENEGHWKPETPASFLSLLGLSALAARPAPAPPARAPAAATPRASPARGVPAPSPSPAAASAGGPYLNTAFNSIFQPYKDSSTTCRELRGRIGTGANPLPHHPCLSQELITCQCVWHSMPRECVTPCVGALLIMSPTLRLSMLRC